jgi:hypothetical protein
VDRRPDRLVPPRQRGESFASHPLRAIIDLCQIEKQPRSVAPTPPVPTPSSASAPVPVHLSPSTSSFPKSAAGASPYDGSPAGSVPTHVKNKFKDLDAFLNSESEEETEESSEE